MNVEIVRWYAQAGGVVYPRLILERGRTWQDWPTAILSPRSEVYETLFDVYYEQAGSASKPQPLGSVKILQREHAAPALRGTLAALPEDCCSLGQTIDYYAAVERLGEPASRAVLTALRDVTSNEDIARAFQGEPGFRESLLRFSEAARIFHHRSKRLHDEREAPEPVRLQFVFRTKLSGFDDPHAIDFEFHPEPKRLGRLLAIVGKNGTGKTRYLARLALRSGGSKAKARRFYPSDRPWAASSP